MSLYLEALKIFNEFLIVKNKQPENLIDHLLNKEKMKVYQFDDERHSEIRDILLHSEKCKKIFQKRKEINLNYKLQTNPKKILYQHKEIICLMMDFVLLLKKHNLYLINEYHQLDEKLERHLYHDFEFFAFNDIKKEEEKINMLYYSDIDLTDEMKKSFMTYEKLISNFMFVQKYRIFELNRIEKLFDERALESI